MKTHKTFSPQTLNKMLVNQPKPKISLAITLVVAWLTTLTLSCQKQALNSELDQMDTRLEANSAIASGSETRPALFGPIAATAGCLGYNVNFTPAQPVILKETTTIDGQGTVHYTRHWSVAGLTARATLPNRPYLENGLPVTFEVISGQEMFVIKDPNTTTGVPSPALSGDVFIHQGTIVLENTLTKERIVIRHVIIQTPGIGTDKDAWYVNGKKCS